MNLSNLMFKIKLKLGLLNISTPIENLDGTIVNILKEITIPTFSIYYPYKESLTLNLTDLESLGKSGTCERFLLPEFKTRKLLYVFDVNYDVSVLSGLGYYGGGMPLLGGNLINQTMLANAGANVMNTMIPKLSFDFREPRELIIYNAYSSTRVKIDLGFEHDPSMATIPETCKESFLELALLDIKEGLYPTLKHYTGLNTAIGNIDLKLDDWANAESERKELISKLDDIYHLDFQPQYWL